MYTYIHMYVLSHVFTSRVSVAARRTPSTDGHALSTDTDIIMMIIIRT